MPGFLQWEHYLEDLIGCFRMALSRFVVRMEGGSASIIALWLTRELSQRAEVTVTIPHYQEQRLDARDVGYHQEPLCHHGCSYFVKLEKPEAEQPCRTSPDQWIRKPTLESVRIECGAWFCHFLDAVLINAASSLLLFVSLSIRNGYKTFSTILRLTVSAQIVTTVVILMALKGLLTQKGESPECC